MGAKIEIDLGNYDPENSDFQEFIKGELVGCLSRNLLDSQMRSSLQEVSKRCILEAEILITASIRNMFQDGVEVPGMDGKQTIRDIVHDAITRWSTGNTTNNSYSQQKNISVLPQLIQKIVVEELTKETTKMLGEIKTDAINTARKKISDTLAARLFDGTKLLI